MSHPSARMKEDRDDTSPQRHSRMRRRRGGHAQQHLSPPGSPPGTACPSISISMDEHLVSHIRARSPSPVNIKLSLSPTTRQTLSQTQEPKAQDTQPAPSARPTTPFPVSTAAPISPPAFSPSASTAERHAQYSAYLDELLDKAQRYKQKPFTTYNHDTETMKQHSTTSSAQSTSQSDTDSEWEEKQPTTKYTRPAARSPSPTRSAAKPAHTHTTHKRTAGGGAASHISIALSPLPHYQSLLNLANTLPTQQARSHTTTTSSAANHLTSACSPPLDVESFRYALLLFIQQHDVHLQSLIKKHELDKEHWLTYKKDNQEWQRKHDLLHAAMRASEQDLHHSRLTVEALTRDQKQAANKCQQLQSVITEKNQTIQHLQTKINELYRQLQLHESHVCRIPTQPAGHTTAAAAQPTVVKRRTVYHDNDSDRWLEDKIQRQKKQITSLENELESVISELRQVRKQQQQEEQQEREVVQEKEREIQTLQERVQQLQHERQEQREAIDRLQEQMQHQQQQLTSSLPSITSLQTQLLQVRTELSATEHQLQQKEQQRQQEYQQQQDKQQQEIKKQEQQLQHKMREEMREEYQQQLQQTRAEQSTLQQQQTEVARNKIQELTKQVQQKEAEIQTLQQQQQQHQQQQQVKHEEEKQQQQQQVQQHQELTQQQQHQQRHQWQQEKDRIQQESRLNMNKLQQDREALQNALETAQAEQSAAEKQLLTLQSQYDELLAKEQQQTLAYQQDRQSWQDARDHYQAEQLRLAEELQLSIKEMEIQQQSARHTSDDEQQQRAILIARHSEEMELLQRTHIHALQCVQTELSQWKRQYQHEYEKNKNTRTSTYNEKSMQQQQHNELTNIRIQLQEKQQEMIGMQQQVEQLQHECEALHKEVQRGRITGKQAEKTVWLDEEKLKEREQCIQQQYVRLRHKFNQCVALEAMLECQSWVVETLIVAQQSTTGHAATIATAATTSASAVAGDGQDRTNQRDALVSKKQKFVSDNHLSIGVFTEQDDRSALNDYHEFFVDTPSSAASSAQGDQKSPNLHARGHSSIVRPTSPSTDPVTNTTHARASSLQVPSSTVSKNNSNHSSTTVAPNYSQPTISSQKRELSTACRKQLLAGNVSALSFIEEEKTIEELEPDGDASFFS